MRLASSCTVMASGMVTSRLSLGAACWLRPIFLSRRRRMAASEGPWSRSLSAPALTTVRRPRANASVAGAADRTFGHGAGAAAGRLQLGGIDQRPDGRHGAARVLRPSASDGGAGRHVRDDRREHCGRGAMPPGRRAAGAGRRGREPGRRAAAAAAARRFAGQRRLRSSACWRALARASSSRAACSRISRRRASSSMRRASFGGEALGCRRPGGPGLAQGALAGIVLARRSARSRGTRRAAAGCGTAAASAARPGAASGADAPGRRSARWRSPVRPGGTTRVRFSTTTVRDERDMPGRPPRPGAPFRVRVFLPPAPASSSRLSSLSAM